MNSIAKAEASFHKHINPLSQNPYISKNPNAEKS